MISSRQECLKKDKEQTGLQDILLIFDPESQNV